MKKDKSAQLLFFRMLSRKAARERKARGVVSDVRSGGRISEQLGFSEKQFLLPKRHRNRNPGLSVQICGSHILIYDTGSKRKLVRLSLRHI